MAAQLPKRILIVDDDPSVLMVWKLVLERAGYVVDATNDIPTARGMCLPKNPYHLVICDGNVHTKNKGDGAAFAQELSLNGIHVVLISSRDYSHLGVPSYIKGITNERLREIVLAHISD